MDEIQALLTEIDNSYYSFREAVMDVHYKSYKFSNNKRKEKIRIARNMSRHLRKLLKQWWQLDIQKNGYV